MNGTARPFRHLCPEADLRDAMDDGEFWAHVFGDGPDLDEPEQVVTAQYDPCPLCGEQGPCGYDAEGRPLIHAVDLDDEAIA